MAQLVKAFIQLMYETCGIKSTLSFIGSQHGSMMEKDVCFKYIKICIITVAAFCSTYIPGTKASNHSTKSENSLLVQLVETYGQRSKDHGLEPPLSPVV